MLNEFNELSYEGRENRALARSYENAKEITIENWRRERESFERFSKTPIEPDVFSVTLAIAIV